jgi:hypothetical protein
VKRVRGGKDIKKFTGLFTRLKIITIFTKKNKDGKNYKIVRRTQTRVLKYGG